MSDNLRARAREAAVKQYADPAPDSTAIYTRHALRYYMRGAYIAGYLAHADRQPSRERIDDVIGEAIESQCPHESDPHLLCNCPDIDPITDAVLRLMDGVRDE